MSKQPAFKLFGTDGVRGRANHFPMTVEVALMLGKAVAVVLRRHNGKHRVVIGKDTRLSCYMFENALVAGLNSMGVDTLMLGPLPTPAVAFITRAYRADAGIVISASHNPYYDNGIKIFTSEGVKLPDTVEHEMEKMIASGDFEQVPFDHELGRNKRIEDAAGRYIEFVKATFPKGKTLKGMKIYLDCANGAAHRVAPLVFWELDADVIVTGNDPNGININDHCGSLNPSVIQKGVIEHKADVGIALDGDGDRIIMIDEKGHIIDGDTILAICAHELKRRDLLKNDRVVATVMSNYGVIKYLESLGIEVILSKVGDRYVIQDMMTHKAYLGGEQSGHMIFLDHNTTGDGIVSALQVLKIMIESESTLSDLASCVKKFPQTLINIEVAKKIPLKKLTTVQKVIQEVEAELSDQGRVLVRYSGTENLCRVMVEGPKKHQVDLLAHKIAKEVESQIGVKKK
ncbi:MAG: phosphoglucosamine mutase [Chlamydiales bacterium]|nr:phosphoglucosamine mutase [Chlamydiales bacterium]